MKFNGKIIKGVAIDFDWTLIKFNYKKAFGETQKILYYSYPVVAEFIKKHFMNEKNIIYFQKFRNQIWESLLKDEKQFILKLQMKYWEVVRSTTKENEGAKSFLNDLKTHGIKIVLITNSDEVFGLKEKRLNESGFDNHVDSVLIGGVHCRYEKPNKKIFYLAAKKIDLQVSECLMIGDSIENDIMPAVLSGMHAIQMKEEGGDWDPSVTSFSQLKAFLEI